MKSRFGSDNGSDAGYDSDGGYYDEYGYYHDATGGYYDENGYYYDSEGGYYDPDGNYFDAEGGIVVKAGQDYARISYTYDEAGNVASQSYFGHFSVKQDTLATVINGMQDVVNYEYKAVQIYRDANTIVNGMIDEMF